MKTAIYYRSIFHGTEMYANWLGEALHADVYKYGFSNAADFTDYERIIIMSAWYMFTFFPAARFIKHNWQRIKDRDVIVISCGAAAGDDPIAKKFYEQIPLEIREKIRIFSLKGAAPFSKGEKQAKDIKKENILPIVKALH